MQVASGGKPAAPKKSKGAAVPAVPEAKPPPKSAAKVAIKTPVAETMKVLLATVTLDLQCMSLYMCATPNVVRHALPLKILCASSLFWMFDGNYLAGNGKSFTVGLLTT